MNSIPRQLVSATLLGSLVLMSALNQNILSAQRGATIAVTRLYTGPDGQTHSEEIEVTLVGAADGLERSDSVKATGLQFVCLPSGRTQDWRTAPRRQYVITVSGRGEIELTSGQKISAEPGRVFLAEDPTGTGHMSRTVGSEHWITAQIPLGGSIVKIRKRANGYCAIRVFWEITSELPLNPHRPRNRSVNATRLFAGNLTSSAIVPQGCIRSRPES
jgi:quercetin dioxygenase-like cupin family protein